MTKVKAKPDKRGGWNKGKKLSYNPRTAITERHFQVRENAWERLKLSLQYHLANAPKGEASKIARFAGIRSSQVHKFACPVCEHNQEPSFSVGMAILVYLQRAQVERATPIIEVLVTPWCF